MAMRAYSAETKKSLCKDGVHAMAKCGINTCDENGLVLEWRLSKGQRRIEVNGDMNQSAQDLFLQLRSNSLGRITSKRVPVYFFEISLIDKSKLNFVIYQILTVLCAEMQ